MKKTVLTILGTTTGLLAIFAVAFLWAGYSVDLSWHGLTALMLGVFFTAAIGALLMGLSFYSSRSGQDQ